MRRIDRVSIRTSERPEELSLRPFLDEIESTKASNRSNRGGNNDSMKLRPPQSILNPALATCLGFGLAVAISGCSTQAPPPRQWGTCGLAGGVIGTAAGAGAGYGIAVLNTPHPSSSEYAATIAGGGVIGAIIGAVVGHEICDPLYPPPPPPPAMAAATPPPPPPRRRQFSMKSWSCVASTSISTKRRSVPAMRRSSTRPWRSSGRIRTSTSM